MSTEKTKLTEEELQQQAIVQPVPADPAEVTAVAPVAAEAVAPVEEVPAAPEVVTEEDVHVTPTEAAVPADPMTPPAPGMIPSGWVQPEALAAAVAQATGDAEAAATAPDATITEEPLVQQPTEVPPAEDANILESLSDEEKNVIKEYRKYKASKLKESDVILPEETEDVAAANKEDIKTDVVGGDLPELAKVEEAVEEDEAVNVCPNCGKEPCECEEECEDEECDEECVEEVEEEFDPELLDKISSFLDEEHIEAEDVTDALETSTAFLNKLLSDDAEDEEKPEVEEKETFSFEDVIGAPEDDVEDADVSELDFVEEEDFEEAQEERVTEAEEHKDICYQILWDHVRNSLEDWKKDMGPAFEGMNPRIVKFARRICLACKLKDAQMLKEALKEFDDIEEATPLYQNTIDVLNGECELEEAKMDEKILYPAGSKPLTSGVASDNLVKEYEKKAEAKRQALAKFRESMRHPQRESEYNEALRSKISLQESAEHSNSWANNKFLDRYEESHKLNYQELLKNGLLG